MIDSSALSYTSFAGQQRIAQGSLAANALAVKQAMADELAGPILTFCDQNGRLVDIDTRGSDAQMLARLPAEQGGAQAADATESQADEPRGRGRPKLGVVAREVTLLPRHWDWLAAQPGGASVSLRKLVEDARRLHAERDRQRQACDAAYHFMSAMAGDLPGFEEASRALFAHDAAKLREHSESWPIDVREHLRQLAALG